MSRLLAALGCLAAIGCSFEKPGAANQMNSCTFDSDCTSKHCEAGLCVMTGAKQLNVTLEVTPKHMPDGSRPFPIVAAPFALQGNNKASFALHLPVAIPVRVHRDDKQVDAQVTFRPLVDTSFVAKSTQIITGNDGPGAPINDVSVVLLIGVDYDVYVQPVDARQPPHDLQLHVQSDTTLDVDYATIAWRERKFVVHNAPTGPLTLRARATTSGQLISNSVPVASDAVTLSFDPGTLAYQLEISATEPTQASADASQCDAAGPLVPTLSVAATTLIADPKDPSLLVIDLPTLPDAIQYSGSVMLCPSQTPVAYSALSSLPMSFKTTSLNFGSDSKMVSATFETATQATWDDDAKSYTFCTQVLPGDYVVIATPPANLTCEIFAEKRMLATDSGSDTQGVTLSLRTPATLSGTVITPDGTPMANAAIDLVALGTDTVTLADNDPTVPTYNRSRQGTSASNGSFKLQPDIGAYDVVIKPPAQSNFAWRVIYDVDIASRTAAFTTTVMLTAPVAVTGSLQYTDGSKSDQSTLASAEVHAYTVVNEGEPSARSVEIARTQADENGNVTLLMSPDLQKSWIPQ